MTFYKFLYLMLIMSVLLSSSIYLLVTIFYPLITKGIFYSNGEWKTRKDSLVAYLFFFFMFGIMPIITIILCVFGFHKFFIEYFL